MSEILKRDPWGGSYGFYRWPMNHRWDRQHFDWGIWFRLRSPRFNALTWGKKIPPRHRGDSLDRKGRRFYWRMPRRKINWT